MEWYGTFWRRFWYEQFTGHSSRVPYELAPPDFVAKQEQFRQVAPELDRVVQYAEHLASLCHQPTVTDGELNAAHNGGIACVRPDHYRTLARPLRWPCPGHQVKSRPPGVRIPNVEDTDV